MSVNKEIKAQIVLQLNELEKTLRENADIDHCILEQSDRLLQTKIRQQQLMDTMANRMDLLFSKWQEYQSQQQNRLQESFNVATANLPKSNWKMLDSKEVSRMKKKLTLVEDKIRILSSMDLSATLRHRSASQSAIKFEQVALKARELEVRLKKLADVLNSKTDPHEEARKVLSVEIERLKKMEGTKKELAHNLADNLKSFLEKNRISPSNSTASLKNGEISATKNVDPIKANDSLADVAKE